MTQTILNFKLKSTNEKLTPRIGVAILGEYFKGMNLVSKDDLEGVKKTLLVYLDEFSDSSIDILVYCYSKSVVWGEWLETKEDVMHKIMEILDKNNLEFAFPSLSIYNENNAKT